MRNYETKGEIRNEDNFSRGDVNFQGQTLTGYSSHYVLIRT